MTTVQSQSSKSRPEFAFWVSLVIWFTVFATFSLPGRGQMGEGELDWVSIIKILARLTSIVALGWLVFSHWRSDRTKQVVVYFLPWIAFAAWALLSTAWSPSRSITLGQAGGQVALLLLSICIALTYRELSSFYCFQCVAALCAYSFLYGMGAVVFPDVFDVSRTSGQGYIHPTALGAASSLGAVLVTCLLMTVDWKWVKPTACVALPVFVIAMLAAHNRTAIALAGFICIGMIIIRGQSQVLALVGVLMAMLGLVYMLADPGLVQMEAAMANTTRFVERDQDSFDLSTLSGREEMWTKMWNSYLDSPWIGHGYFVCSESGELFVWNKKRNHTAHNIVLQALVTTGVIGFLMFGFWNFRLLTRVFGRSDGWETGVKILAISLFIWFAVWASLNSFVLGPVRPGSAVYALLAGLIVGRFHSAKESRPSS